MHFSLILAAALAASPVAAAHGGTRHVRHRRVTSYKHEHHHRHYHHHRSQHEDDDDEGAADDEEIYMPINVVRSKDSGIIETRDTSTLANMDPGQSAHMLFGKVIGEGGELHIADMMLHADPSLPIVMMEAFEGLTSAVDCQGDDGQMSLTFSSAESYNHAIESWAYINEDTERQFLMIANHESCGAKHQRQLYKITDVDNDDDQNLVTLSATPRRWSEEAGSFEMEFGKAQMSPSARRSLRKRGLFDKIKDGFEKVGDGLEDIGEKIGDRVEDTVEDVYEGIKELGEGDISESVSFPVSVGEKDKEVKLFEDPTTLPPKLKLFCTNCFIDAKFEATGKLEVKDFKPSSLALEVSPQKFEAAIELKAEISQKNPDLESLKFSHPIVEAAIPGAGIVVPGIFTLGAKAAFNVQGIAMIYGMATVSFGVRGSIPKGSKIIIDLVDYDRSGAEGFEKAEFEPVFDLDKASLTANFIAGPEQALTFGVEVLDEAKIDAGIAFGTPKFNVNVTAGYDEEGFCSPDDTVTSGVETIGAANFDAILSITAGAEKAEHRLLTKKVMNIPAHTFFDKCKPLPGITPPKDEGPPSSSVLPPLSAPSSKPSSEPSKLSSTLVSSSSLSSSSALPSDTASATPSSTSELEPPESSEF